MEPSTEQDIELTFTVRITTNGRKPKAVADIGRTLAKSLHLNFGDRFVLLDHKLQVIEFDPDAHDFGIGET